VSDWTNPCSFATKKQKKKERRRKSQHVGRHVNVILLLVQQFYLPEGTVLKKVIK
jgi:hypothetical protein